jgi:hypothetical protein
VEYEQDHKLELIFVQYFQVEEDFFHRYKQFFVLFLVIDQIQMDILYSFDVNLTEMYLIIFHNVLLLLKVIVVHVHILIIPDQKNPLNY